MESYKFTQEIFQSRREHSASVFCVRVLFVTCFPKKESVTFDERICIKKAHLGVSFQQGVCELLIYAYVYGIGIADIYVYERTEWTHE